MSKNFTDFLSIHLFSHISPTSLEKLNYLVKPHFYKKGIFILNKSEIQNTFLFVRKGWIKLCKESAVGEEIIIDILTDQHYCGEQFLFHTDTIDTYTVQTISDVEIITLPIQALNQLIKSDHQLALNFLQETLQKKQNLNLEIEHLSIQSALQRIGCFMLRLCNLEECNTVKLQLPYDKFLLATRLGMRAETFSRALAKLSQQCDIQIHDNKVYVNDVQELSQFVCQQCSKTFPCKK